LLNAEFQGDEKNPDNLTILTVSTNSQHKKFDNTIKAADENLKGLYTYLNKNLIDVSQTNFGIQVSISVSDNKSEKTIQIIVSPIQ
jgi:hypothetical protein